MLQKLIAGVREKLTLNMEHAIKLLTEMQAANKLLVQQLEAKQQMLDALSSRYRILEIENERLKAKLTPLQRVSLMRQQDNVCS